jgi:hypothetical protein
MLAAILERQAPAPSEELLKLYWNRADVKRELRALRRERFELLDKLKEQRERSCAPRSSSKGSSGC